MGLAYSPLHLPDNPYGVGKGIAPITPKAGLTLSGPDYAKIPTYQNKCNAFVAEVIYDAFGIEFKAIPSDQEQGKYFPYRAEQWADPNTSIPHFPIIKDGPQLGDIWAIHEGATHHVGIYLGKYNGVDLYISARGDSLGVFGLDKAQFGTGIQIKPLPSRGIFRRYSP